VSQYDWGAGQYYPMLRKFFDTFFKGDFPLYGKQVFHEHYADIRRLVPAERLLEYKVADGWEPLCKFLGHAIPTQTFPRSNSISEFRSRCRLRNRHQMQNVAFSKGITDGSNGVAIVSEKLEQAERQRRTKTTVLA
jgi:hypothetical protein